MTPPFSYDLVIAFGILGVFLLLGVALRAKIGFLQRLIAPSCLVGGVVGLVVINVIPMNLDTEMFEAVVYHLFTLSFVSLGLTAFGASVGGHKATGSELREVVRGAAWGGALQGVTLSVQALVGIGLYVLFRAAGTELFPTFGLFPPLGFTQGPGQALSIGKVWEGFGFANAATIGLTFASIGFAFAFFVGVPLVNWGIRQLGRDGKPVELPPALRKGYVPKDEVGDSAGNQSTHSSNVDALAFQFALSAGVMLLTYGFVTLLNSFFSETVASLLWGFTFFFGLLMAILVGWIAKLLGVSFLIDKGVQKRITGFSVDFLIVATIMAIQPTIVFAYVVPILVISLAAGIATTFVVIYFGRRITGYNLQRMALNYGTCTGTLSSGLLLLRMTDPDFSSPVGVEAGFIAVFALPFVLSSMLLANARFLFGWDLGLVVVGFLVIMVVSLLIIKLMGQWGKKRV